MMIKCENEYDEIVILNYIVYIYKKIIYKDLCEKVPFVKGTDLG
jgi:hypothetical protein